MECIIMGSGVDISQDTVTAAVLVDGYTAHNAAGPITGSLKLQTYYVREDTPPNTLGVDGDLVFVTGG